MTTDKPNTKIKATLFSELFKDPQRLRELYNALANTNYDEKTKVKIVTLKNVLYKGMKTDVSFTIGDRQVILIEHQSTMHLMKQSNGESSTMYLVIF